MRNLVKQRWLSVSSGLLYGLSWEPYGLWPLAIAGWVGWLWGMRVLGRSGAFLHSFLFILSSWIVAFHWVMAHPMTMAAVTSGFALVAYATVFAAMTAWTTSLAPASKNRGDDPSMWHRRGLAAIIGAMIFDIALFNGPFAMPWLSLGWSMAPSYWALRAGSLLGIHGAALLILLMAGSVAYCLAHYQAKPSRAAVAAGAVLFLFTLPYWATDVTSDKSGPSLRVRLLEPGFSPQQWSSVDDLARIDTFASILAEVNAAGPSADMTILPETALPLGGTDSLSAWINTLRVAARGSVLSGGIRKESDDTNEQAYNVIISSDTSLRPYAKRRLVPFAESVPFSDWIPGFRRLAVPSGGIASYASGDSLLPIPFGGQDVVPLICFESLFVQDARKALLAGGRMLIVTTQDGWWGSELPRRQHLAFSQMLAASTGHPVAHATVDGYSGLIDAGGQLAYLSQEHPQILTGNIPLTTRGTLFMKMGNRPFFAILAALAVLLIPLNREARTVHLVREPLS